MGDPTLRFNVDLSYGCSVSYTFEDLKNGCDSITSPIANLEIFRNLEGLDSFGHFGNAYIYYPKVSHLPSQCNIFSFVSGLEQNIGSP